MVSFCRNWRPEEEEQEWDWGEGEKAKKTLTVIMTSDVGEWYYLPGPSCYVLEGPDPPNLHRSPTRLNYCDAHLTCEKSKLSKI